MAARATEQRKHEAKDAELAFFLPKCRRGFGYESTTSISCRILKLFFLSPTEKQTETEILYQGDYHPEAVQI